jgi:hypothetical protein
MPDPLTLLHSDLRGNALVHASTWLMMPIISPLALMSPEQPVQSPRYRHPAKASSTPSYCPLAVVANPA